MKYFPATLLGVIGALLALLLPISLPAKVLIAWAWLGSYASLLPWVPWRIRFRVGKPIPPGELFRTGADDELPQAYQRVESTVQDLVTSRIRR